MLILKTFTENISCLQTFQAFPLNPNIHSRSIVLFTVTLRMWNIHSRFCSFKSYNFQKTSVFPTHIDFIAVHRPGQEESCVSGDVVLRHHLIYRWQSSHKLLSTQLHRQETAKLDQRILTLKGGKLVKLLCSFDIKVKTYDYTEQGLKSAITLFLSLLKWVGSKLSLVFQL